MLVPDCSDTETRVLPAWTIFALMHEANADGEIWSYRLALNTSRAAALITDCKGRSWYNGRPANVAFPKSSFDNTRATTMDWKTERVSELRILFSRLSMKKNSSILSVQRGNTCSPNKFPGRIRLWMALRDFCTHGPAKWVAVSDDVLTSTTWSRLLRRLTGAYWTNNY